MVDYSSRMVKLGHNIVVISNGGELLRQLEANGIKHYTLPVHSKNPLTVLRMIPAVRKILVQEKADILNAESRVPAIIGYYAARSAGVVFITTCHAYYSKKPLSFSKVMGWGKLVIAVSQVIAKHMIDNFNVPFRRIRLVYRGVDVEKFKYREPDESVKHEYTIGIVGRLTPIKGHKYFIRAVSKAVKYVPRIKVLIVGDAPPEKEKYKQELESLVNRLGLSRYVEFLGGRSDIPDILARLDLLVMASIVPEGFTMVDGEDPFAHALMRTTGEQWKKIFAGEKPYAAIFRFELDPQRADIPLNQVPLVERFSSIMQAIVSLPGLG